MFYTREARNLSRAAIFERRRGRLGSKISSYGQLAKVAAYLAMSGLPRKHYQSEWVGMASTLAR
jgi:hypothetical protein